MLKSLEFCGIVASSMTQSKDMEDIATFIRRILEEKNLTEPQAAKNARNQIKQSVINALKNKRVLGENAEIGTLYNLAKALDEPPAIVFAKALKISPAKLGFEDEQLSEAIIRMVFYFSQLPENRQNDLLQFAGIFIEQEKKQAKGTTGGGSDSAKFIIDVPKENFLQEATDDEYAARKLDR